MQEGPGMELTAGKIVRVAGAGAKKKDEEIREPLHDSIAGDEILKVPDEPEDGGTSIGTKHSKNIKENVCKYIFWFLILSFILGILQ